MDKSTTTKIGGEIQVEWQGDRVVMDATVPLTAQCRKQKQNAEKNNTNAEREA
jgi:predicted dinucleotide-binding enzyme